MRFLGKWVYFANPLCFRLKPICIFWLLLAAWPLSGQLLPDLSNARSRVFPLDKDTLVLDSLTVFPSSLTVLDGQGNRVSPGLFRLTDNRLVWSDRPPGDSVWVSFRVMPHALGRPIARPLGGKGWGSGLLADTSGFYRPSNAAALAKMEFRGLDYSGSFERGIAFGNNQSLVVNSSFNLQLAGKLGEDLEINAALTDANIPLQAAGNTARLQELDRVFVQLKRKKTVLTAGDYELKRPQESFFLHYLKKAQGATLQTEIALPGRGVLKLDGSLALSRGKFGRNIFQGKEGNQGPYRLTGNDGETFIIVLSGTERVFIDGNLMQRGQDKDYVIDYNTGELVFTANRLITKDIRIQVEFGYALQNYVRTLYAVNAAWRLGHWAAHVHVFSEQDGRNQTALFALTDEDRRILSEAGDDPARTVRLAIDTLPQGFDPNRIQYRMVDTLVGGVWYDSVLVYSTDPANARYVAGFSSVGPGNGDYRLLQSSANGRVYEWVAPDPASGRRGGDHAPIIRLVSPKRLQVFSFGGEAPLGKNGRLTAEIALSRNDLNTFSDRDAEDDNGLAWQLGYQDRFVFFSEKKIPQQDTGSNRVIDLLVDAHYEGVQKNFQWIEPYRKREFVRDWNTGSIAQRTHEHLGIFGATLRDSRLGRIRYEFSGLGKDSLYLGLRHLAQLDLRWRGLRVLFNGSLTQSTTPNEKSDFWRPNLTLTYSFPRLAQFTLGAYAEREDNRRRDRTTDTLLAGSFRWDILRAWAELPSADSSLFVRLATQFRRDYHADSLWLSPNSEAREVSLSGGWSVPQKKIRLQGSLIWRDLRVMDTLLLSDRSGDTYLGRLEYGQTLAKGAVRLNTLYQLGTGQQRQTDYVYLRVNPGEGVYAWIDRNLDSIPQLNEFEVSPFADQASYVRITQFTDRFVRTADLLFAQSLHLTPKSAWIKAPKGSLRAWLGRFSYTGLYRLERRALSRSLSFDPFTQSLPDSLLLSQQSDLRNTVFFNRTHPRFGLEWTHTAAENRTTPLSGWEVRRRWDMALRGRWNITPRISANLSVNWGGNANETQFFADRNFRLENWRIEPQAAWVPNKQVRLTAFYRLREVRNTIGPESLRGQELGLEWAWNKAAKNDLRAKLTFARMEFLGNQGSPTAYAMLEGLQGGNNFLWSVNWRRFLNRFLELTLGYEGRKTGPAQMVHVGRMQIRASF
jgi:hypothetical protein